MVLSQHIVTSAQVLSLTPDALTQPRFRPNPEAAYLQQCSLNIGDREAQLTDFPSIGRYSAGLPFIVVPQMSG